MKQFNVYKSTMKYLTDKNLSLNAKGFLTIVLFNDEIIGLDIQKYCTDNKETISLLVTIKTEIIDGKFFTSKTYSVEELNKSYKQLANAINSINKEFHGKTISYWANFGTGNGLDEQLKKELRTDNI